MPHDNKGQLLTPGDRVAITGTVRQVFPQEDYCNVAIETDGPMFPRTQKSLIAVNSRQVEKLASETKEQS